MLLELILQSCSGQGYYRIIIFLSIFCDCLSKKNTDKLQTLRDRKDKTDYQKKVQKFSVQKEKYKEATTSTNKSHLNYSCILLCSSVAFHFFIPLLKSTWICWDHQFWRSSQIFLHSEINSKNSVFAFFNKGWEILYFPLKITGFIDTISKFN